MKNLTASDRSALIKLAASLPKGSPERRAILAGWQSSAARNSWNDNPYLGDGMNHAIVKFFEHLYTANGYQNEIRVLSRKIDTNELTELAANDKAAASALRLINEISKMGPSKLFFYGELADTLIHENN
jgi:hypothetical protein